MSKLRMVMVAGTVLATTGLVLGGGIQSYAAAPTFNLVTDGGFEDPSVGGPFTTFNAGQNFGGWHVDSGGIDLINTYWTSEEGVQSVDMNSTVPGAISQTVNGLTVGQQYQLSFWLAGNPTGGPAIKTLDTSLDGNTVLSSQFDVTGKSYTNMGWTEYTYDFTAANTSTDLAFASTTTDACTPASSSAACGPALDNVSIKAVPEAATTITATVYVLLTGLLLIVRNRKRAKMSA